MSTRKPATATARVIVTLDIPANGCWGEECTLAQIQKQAKESVLGTLQIKLIQASTSFRLVGEPKVTVVLVQEEL
jgi:hypothetical protein